MARKHIVSVMFALFLMYSIPAGAMAVQDTKATPGLSTAREEDPKGSLSNPQDEHFWLSKTPSRT